MNTRCISPTPPTEFSPKFLNSKFLAMLERMRYGGWLDRLGFFFKKKNVHLLQYCITYQPDIIKYT